MLIQNTSSQSFWFQRVHLKTWTPSVWAEEPSDAKRTNNGSESFHAHFNEQFYVHHPTIYIFIDVITKLQATTYIKFRFSDKSALVSKKEKERIYFLMDMFQKKEAGICTRSQFIKSISFRFRARTDI